MSTGQTYLPELEDIARHMPFDQFGRYHMLREAVDACRAKLGIAQLSILDVGGFYAEDETPTLPLLQFLPHDEVTILDIVDCDLPGYVKGDGTALQFDDASFDLVVSADTLEHIPVTQRRNFWRELLRVARYGVILLAPFGTPEVEAVEDLLFAYIKADLGAEQEQLKEHREYGLPVLDEWLTYLTEQDIPHRSYPTGYLHAWIGMMLIKHILLRINAGSEAQHAVDWYYNRNFFPGERRNPAYRHLIVAEKVEHLVDAVDAVLEPTIQPDQPDISTNWGPATLVTMFTLVQRQMRGIHENYNEQITRYHQHVGEQLKLFYDHLSAQIKHNRIQIGTQNQTFKAQVNHYRQQISYLERLIADQQIAMNQMSQSLHQQNMHTHLLTVQHKRELEQATDAIRDLKERARWLEDQNKALGQQFEAVKNGRIMRILHKLLPRP
jgi:hypothetical protein